MFRRVEIVSLLEKMLFSFRFLHNDIRYNKDYIIVFDKQTVNEFFSIFLRATQIVLCFKTYNDS